MRFETVAVSTFAGQSSSGPVWVERMALMDNNGTVLMFVNKAADGAVTIEINTDCVMSSVGAIALASTNIIFSALPTADPIKAGQLWNSAGTLKVSAGV
jgi:hypothetical protein